MHVSYNAQNMSGTLEKSLKLSRVNMYIATYPVQIGIKSFKIHTTVLISLFLYINHQVK